jgi:hypothetical protein
MNDIKDALPALELLSGIIKPGDLKESLQLVQDAINAGQTQEQILLGLGIAAMKNFLDTFKGIANELKEQTIQLEVQTGWVKTISDAIREHTVDLNHTVR